MFLPERGGGAGRGRGAVSGNCTAGNCLPLKEWRRKGGKGDVRECGAKAERARQINSIYSSAEDNNIPFIGGGGDATHSVVRVRPSTHSHPGRTAPPLC